MLLRLLILIIMPGVAIAQQSRDTCYRDEIEDEEQREKIFKEATIDASFKGGKAKWSKYLQENLNFGKVITGLPDTLSSYNDSACIRFVVDRNGKLSNMEVVDDPNPELVTEVMRIIKSSCTGWNPPVSSGGRAINAWHRERIFITINRRYDSETIIIVVK
jgi:hypothetical protein